MSDHHHHPSAIVERPRFFPRQVVTPDLLNLSNQYFQDRLRRHNRMMHGWGVVCGAIVCRVGAADGTGTEPWVIKISPGYLLDPSGNEVSIPVDRVVDVRSDGATAMPDDPPGELSDPWCIDLPPENRTGKLWVAVRYEEILARPVRTQPSSCDCGGAGCEYSRWRDGYTVGFLTGCPDSHQGDPPDPATWLASGPVVVECPPHTANPWVVLASIDVGADGVISSVDNCSCRRVAVSLAEQWHRCVTSATKITAVDAVPGNPQKQGATGIVISLKGSGFDSRAQVSLGPGITVKITQVDATGSVLQLSAKVHKNAKPGDRTLTITNPDCSTMTEAKVLTIS